MNEDRIPVVKYKALFELRAYTKNKGKFRVRLPLEEAVRNDPLGYIYITKTKLKEMGDPLVIEVQITPYLAPEPLLE